MDTIVIVDSHKIDNHYINISMRINHVNNTIVWAEYCVNKDKVTCSHIEAALFMGTYQGCINYIKTL